MPGVPRRLDEHALEANKTVRPIKQKLWRFAKDRKQTIEVEVCNLLAAGFIRECKHPVWLANLVLVPKKTGGLRMHIDYIDLNKHCPKDPFPLPRIDQVVNSTVDSVLLCFLDCYSGYHQIALNPDNGDKTTTSRDVVTNDVTLTSLKTPEWSQLVFCDDFVLVTMMASHLFIGDKTGFFVIDVSPIYDEFCVVMDLNSFYDERFCHRLYPVFVIISRPPG
jgi:hypothetical protein